MINALRYGRTVINNYRAILLSIVMLLALVCIEPYTHPTLHSGGHDQPFPPEFSVSSAGIPVAATIIAIVIFFIGGHVYRILIFIRQ